MRGCGEPFWCVTALLGETRLSLPSRNLPFACILIDIKIKPVGRSYLCDWIVLNTDGLQKRINEQELWIKNQTTAHCAKGTNDEVEQLEVGDYIITSNSAYSGFPVGANWNTKLTISNPPPKRYNLKSKHTIWSRKYTIQNTKIIIRTNQLRSFEGKLSYHQICTKDGEAASVPSPHLVLESVEQTTVSPLAH